MIPCSYWALTCCAALPSCKTLYVISVRQTRDLPVVSLFPHPASFRFHLTMDTLAFGYILPTTRRIRDLHPLETCAAGRTQKAVIIDFLYYNSFVFLLLEWIYYIISFFSVNALRQFHSFSLSVNLYPAFSDLIPADLISFQMKVKALSIPCVNRSVLWLIGVVYHTILFIFHISMYFHIIIGRKPTVKLTFRCR